MIALVPTISKMVSCTSLDLNYIEEEQNLKARSDCKMAQWVQTIATKPGDLSSVPRTHTVERTDV